MWAVLPLKDLNDSKQRLARHLPPPARRALVTAMAMDTLAALSSTSCIEKIFIVSRCPDAAIFAAQFGATVLDLVEDTSLNSGVTAAVQHLQNIAAGQQHSLLVMHVDLPLITANDIRMICEQHRQAQADVSLVPDHQHNGTNAMLLNLPTYMQFAYGEQSFDKHLAIAAQTGLATHVIENANIQIDLDQPEDLQRLMQYRLDDTHTARWLQQGAMQRAAN